jgi:hypothetical protein
MARREEACTAHCCTLYGTQNMCTAIELALLCVRVTIVGKSMCFLYSQCVSHDTYQYSKAHFVLYGFPYFPHYHLHIFLEKIIKHKMCVFISSTKSETSLILRNI